MTTGGRAPETSESMRDVDPAAPTPADAPARGIVWGLLISVPAFWIPLILLVVYLVSRS